MPPKRRANETITSKVAPKISKLSYEETDKNTIEKANKNQIHKIECVLKKSDCNSSDLALLKNTVKTSDLPSNLAFRLLEFSSKVGSERLAQKILKYQSINLKTSEGGQALLKAVDAGNTVIASLLVRSGADVNVRDPDKNCTPLYKVLSNYAIRDDAKREELARLMLDYGADVNAGDNDGYSILNAALSSKKCSTLLVENLLERGAVVTCGGEFHWDDIYWASHHRPELLLKLIQHQVPDEDTKIKRALFALQDLISKKSDKSSLRIMKSILDLGVPVDKICRRKESITAVHCTLLCKALHDKKKDAIKLLLDFGADPLVKDERGDTTLYLATAFKGYTHASRWLIEKGASIHTRNKDGSYPIHGACIHDSLRNIHLFVNLGANLNVIDDKGRTPFRFTQDTFDFNEAHHIVIKYFALAIAKGEKVNDEDVEKAMQFVWGHNHFNECTEQLRQMKDEMICDGVSYFSLFTRSINSMLRLMKNQVFVKNFKTKGDKRGELFPKYSYMLLHAFEVAEMRYKVWKKEEQYIQDLFQEAFGETVPDHIAESIAYYVCSEKKFEQCQYDFYMSLHASLKNNKSDKEKIL